MSGWVSLETDAPMWRWQTTLTVAEPDSGSQSLAIVTAPTLQIEGEFGTALLDVLVSNSDEGYHRVGVYQDPEWVPLPPAYRVRVRVSDADETTALVVTVAGRR